MIEFFATNTLIPWDLIEVIFFGDKVESFISHNDPQEENVLSKSKIILNP